MFVLDWKIIAAVVGALSVIGLGFYIDSLQNKVKEQNDTIVELRTQIRTMTTDKNNQIRVSGKTVTKVIKGQETVRTIIKEVEKTPNPPACATPNISDAARNLL